MLVKSGRVWRKKGPLLQHTEATYWAANSYLPLDGGRQRRGPARQEELCGSLHHHQDYVAAAAACSIRGEEAEPVAQAEDREVCVYMEQVVLSWLPVFAGSGCVCALLAAVKPCFLSGISVLTERIWVLGELPACWFLTCTHKEREKVERGVRQIEHKLLLKCCVNLPFALFTNWPMNPFLSLFPSLVRHRHPSVVFYYLIFFMNGCFVGCFFYRLLLWFNKDKNAVKEVFFFSLLTLFG